MSATGTALQAIEPQIPQAYMEELKQLVSHDLPRFYRQAYRQLENPHDAEDAVQDAIVSAYKNLSQFGSRAQLSTWFMAIVINAARMQRRRRRPFVSFDEQPSSREDGMTLFDTCADNHPGPEDTCSQSELRNLLARAIDQLSPVSRRAIRNYMEGMTAAEASRALGVPVGTIKAQLSRARTKLVKLLRREIGPRVPPPRSQQASRSPIADVIATKELVHFERNVRRASSGGTGNAPHRSNSTALVARPA